VHRMRKSSDNERVFTLRSSWIYGQINEDCRKLDPVCANVEVELGTERALSGKSSVASYALLALYRARGPPQNHNLLGALLCSSSNFYLCNILFVLERKPCWSVMCFWW
jgi:hypothetical protein